MADDLIRILSAESAILVPTDTPQEPPATPSSPEPGAGQRPLVYQSKDLLQGRNEVWIEHGNEMYRLRLTSSGKLYLTK